MFVVVAVVVGVVVVADLFFYYCLKGWLQVPDGCGGSGSKIDSKWKECDTVPLPLFNHSAPIDPPSSQSLQNTLQCGM